MLKIHILNVGDGNCAILEYSPTNAPSSFGVIDSNWVKKNSSSPPVLTKLLNLGAKEVSFIALTHPDADHYTGLSKVLEHYNGKVKEFYTFPLDLVSNPKLLSKYGKTLNNLRGRTPQTEFKSQLEELISILLYGKKHLLRAGNWTDCSGDYNQIAPTGFNGVDFRVLLPPKKAKGDFFKLIDSEDPNIANKIGNNDMSLAFVITYAGVSVIISGDGTLKNWRNHKAFMQRGGTNVASDLVQIPHHGSRTDSSAEVLEYLFTPGSKTRFAFISADGNQHPHPDVIQWLSANKVKPYCTNLFKKCGKIKQVTPDLGDINPSLKNMLHESLDPKSLGIPTACQGDICLSIQSNGVTSITPQYNTPCPYR